MTDEVFESLRALLRLPAAPDGRGRGPARVDVRLRVETEGRGGVFFSCLRVEIADPRALPFGGFDVRAVAHIPATGGASCSTTSPVAAWASWARMESSAVCGLFSPRRFPGGRIPTWSRRCASSDRQKFVGDSRPAKPARGGPTEYRSRPGRVSRSPRRLDAGVTLRHRSPRGPRSRAASCVKRVSVLSFFTAIARARFVPTRTTSFLARVMPV